jgi:hypothetical protein
MATIPDSRLLTRRTLLRAVAAAGAAAALPGCTFGLAQPDEASAAADAWQAAVATYLETLRRPDGGYAWPGQARAHLTPTFAAIGAYVSLGLAPPQRPALAQFIRTHHPRQLKKLEQEQRVFLYQQVQALVWLGEDAAALADEVSRWQAPVAYMKAYEKHGRPVFASEAAALLCRNLLGMPADQTPAALAEYLDSRRRPDGTYNNTPASDGTDGHVINTWWGLEAERALGREPGDRAATVAWLRACRRPGGGFTHCPHPAIGPLDDVACTWAAVRALARLGAAPADRDACLAYLASLWNADGGFGDRPGWASNPVATYYAVDALAALGAAAPAAPPRTARRAERLPDDLKVFSIQIEAHGQGSPAEAVDLARSLGIHLWGAKNAEPAWLTRAQAAADAAGAPVRFFASNEEYGTWIDVPGQGTYSHMSDSLAPAGADAGPSLAGRGDLQWDAFRRDRLAPLTAAGGRLIWQFGENEALVRMLLDDALARGGYAAISTFHFGNPDFTNSEPFLMRWRGQLPFVALQDAHGPEPWWFADMTEGFRTLFLAREATWEGWLEALAANRVAAVRRDSASGGETWMHAPSDEVADFVRRREDAWRWWDNPRIARPLVSIVAVRPDDAFETARPQRGVTIRVRTAWTNTTQGRPKSPIAELVRLVVDGRDASPSLIAPAGSRGAAHDDHYHALHLPDPSPGRHAATAFVRRTDTGAESSRTVEFSV